MKRERNLKLHRSRKNSSENDFDKINKAVKRLIIAAAAAAVMTGCASASPTGESAAAAVSEEYDLTGAGGENTAGAHPVRITAAAAANSIFFIVSFTIVSFTIISYTIVSFT